MTLPEFCASTANSIRRGPFGSAIKKEFFVSSGYKVYEQQNAIYDDCELGNYFIDGQKFKELKSFEVGPGDIIISCSGTIGRIAILPAWAKKGIINQALLKLTLNNLVILPQYFLFLFRQKVDELIAGNVRGSAMVNITGVKDLKKIHWPIPPLGEQREIVAEIEKQFTRLEAGVAGLRRVQVNLKRYRAAVLKAACEGKLVPTEAELARQEGRTYETGAQLLKATLIARHNWFDTQQLGTKTKKNYRKPESPDTSNLPILPEGWTWATWDQLSNWVTYGFTRPMPHVEEGIPIVTAKNVVGEKINFGTADLTKNEAFESLSEKDRPKLNDILITKDGTIGRAALVDTDRAFCINQSVAVIWLRSCTVERKYLLSVIASELTQKPIWAKARGVAIQHLSITDFAKMPIPIPPIAEQKRIVAEVERRLSVMDELEAVVNANLQRATRLRQSILQRAFEGALLDRNGSDYR